MKMRRAMRLSKGDYLFVALNYVFLGIVLVIVLYPMIYIISCSFSSAKAVAAGKVWLFPINPTFSGYRAVFRNPSILSGYLNTLYYSSLGTMLNVFMTIIAAYPLSRKDFRARNLLMLIFAFTMFFNGGLIPTYILITKLKLLNTRAVMIVPVALSVWNVIITRTYFESAIPSELFDSAQIDGCSYVRFLVSVVLPLSTAIIAVITLFYAVSHWNRFFEAFIYLNDKKYYPLQLILREILLLSQMDSRMISNVNIEDTQGLLGFKELIKYSVIIVASAPVLLLYPFVQRYFVKGIMIGAIK